MFGVKIAHESAHEIAVAEFSSTDLVKFPLTYCCQYATIWQKGGENVSKRKSRRKDGLGEKALLLATAIANLVTAIIALARVLSE